MLDASFLIGHKSISVVRKFCPPVSASKLSALGKSSEQLTVYFGASKLSRMYVIFEKKVNLAERAILGLRKSIPAPYIAQKIGARIKESRFCSPVPSWKISVSMALKTAKSE